MQRIRLSTNIVLEITDEVVSRSLNITPFLHVYEYGSSNYNNKQIVLSDNETEERTKSYWTVGSNTILSTTPTFYPDYKINAGFHNDSNINNLLSPTVLSSQLQYKKIRMLFSQGFSYDLNDGVALTTLNLYAIRPSNNSRIDLLSFYDIYDNSSILAIPQVLFDNQLFNSAIELKIIDLEYLYNNQQSDIVAIKNLLFGNDNIETLFIEHAGVKYDDITTFTEFGNVYTKFSDSDKNRTQVSTRYSNDEIVCKVSKNSNGSVSAQMIHEKFSLQGFLEKTSEIVSIEYTYKFDEYDVSSSLIGSTVIKLSSPLSPFNEVYYKIDPNVLTYHINVTVECRITQFDNTTIIRDGSVVITDTSILKTLELSAVIEEEKLIASTIKQVKKVVYTPDTPKIIKIEKPIYIHAQQTVDTITLLPYSQSITLNLSTDVTLSRQLKLVLGKYIYYNETDDKLTFRIGSESYFITDSKWYILDENDQTIGYGDIIKI